MQKLAGLLLRNHRGRSKLENHNAAGFLELVSGEESTLGCERRAWSGESGTIAWECGQLRDRSAMATGGAVSTPGGGCPPAAGPDWLVAAGLAAGRAWFSSCEGTCLVPLATDLHSCLLPKWAGLSLPGM